MYFPIRISSILIVFFVLLFSSCKEKLELNAPYKEIPSVYAVLNIEDSVHVIRINKIFLGEGDANIMAQVADSVNYPEGELNVTLTSSQGQEIIFGESVIQTNPGAFSTTQRVYVSNAKLTGGEIYTLKIKNNRTGNEFTAKDTALNALNVLGTYRPFVPLYYPVPAGSPATDDNFINYSGQNVSYAIRYSPNESAIYQLLIRMHFYDSLGDGNRIERYLDYPFTNQYRTDKVAGGPNNGLLLTTFYGRDLFTAAGVGMSKLSSSPLLLGRKMYMIEYFIYASTQEYLDYLEYSKPSFNISQSKPIYSNFKENAAIGIFTFRSEVNVKKNMANAFISEFATNPNTCSYQFYNAALSKPGCK